MPRRVIPPGYKTISEANRLYQQAQAKGRGEPVFISNPGPLPTDCINCGYPGVVFDYYNKEDDKGPRYYQCAEHYGYPPTWTPMQIEAHAKAMQEEQEANPCNDDL